MKMTSRSVSVCKFVIRCFTVPVCRENWLSVKEWKSLFLISEWHFSVTYENIALYIFGSVEIATFIIHYVSHLTQKVTLNTDEKDNVFFYLQDESCTQVIFQVGNWQASIYCKINERDNWQKNQFFKIQCK